MVVSTYMGSHDFRCTKLILFSYVVLSKYCNGQQHIIHILIVKYYIPHIYKCIYSCSDNIQYFSLMFPFHSMSAQIYSFLYSFKLSNCAMLLSASQSSTRLSIIFNIYITEILYQNYFLLFLYMCNQMQKLDRHFSENFGSIIFFFHPFFEVQIHKNTQ